MRTSVHDQDVGTGRSEDGPTGRHPRHLLGWAWVCVGLIPVALAIAMVVSDGILTLLGYETGDPTKAPLGPAILAGLPALLVMLSPGVLAVWLGSRALDDGDDRAIVPLSIGAVATLGMLLLGLASLVFSG